MTELILILAACGITYAIQAGKASLITDQLVKLSFFRAMFLCVFCTGCQSGFWLYLAFSLLNDGFSLGLLFAIPMGLCSGFVAMTLEGWEANRTQSVEINRDVADTMQSNYELNERGYNEAQERRRDIDARLDGSSKA
ncbi:MAG: hypothetical protein GY871_13350 [Actinomycetales bacterium]|nr:hypothetical protein [Actinomycetales bacterium]